MDINWSILDLFVFNNLLDDMMLLKGKVLLCYLFAPYVGRETLMQLLAKQRANVRQLQRANR